MPLGQTWLLRCDASLQVSVATASENEALPQLQPFRSQGHRGADKAICLYGEKRTLTKKKATPAQVSLAWLLVQKPFIVPIPGTRGVDHLRENLRAIDVQLMPADLREIETA
jgi:aryl-alcohol dehydrogenase-like predicted oxidoreductase